MEGEFFGRQDVIAFTRETRGQHAAVRSAWQESLHRIARAQAVLWSRTDIKERQRILQQVDAEEEQANIVNSTAPGTGA